LSGQQVSLIMNLTLPEAVSIRTAGLSSQVPFVPRGYVNRQQSSSIRGTPFRVFRSRNWNRKRCGRTAWNEHGLTSHCSTQVNVSRALRWPDFPA